MEVHCEARVGAALLFIGTKRMLGRVTASQIASASIASFLPRSRQALTSFGGTSRTSWPSAITSRAQWYAGARASILIRRGARRAKNASRSIYCAEKLSRVDGHNHLPKLVLGLTFSDGIEVSQPTAAADRPTRHQNSEIARNDAATS